MKDEKKEVAYLCYRARDPKEGICRTGPFSFKAAFKWMLQFLPSEQTFDSGNWTRVYVETVLKEKAEDREF